MLERVALSDLASVLCARKFSFAPLGGGPKVVPFSFLFIIILFFIHYYFWSFEIGRRYFYVFFNLAAASGPQHCALVLKKILIRGL